MFIQIHTLTGYAGVLLNRDDAGMAKRITYGDSVRTRLSSQSAKRKIRMATGENSLQSDLGIAVRSRETFKRCVAWELVEEGHDEAAVIAATLVIMDKIYKPSPSAKKKRAEFMKDVEKGHKEPIDVLDRNEINILSRAEIAYIKGLVGSCVTGATAESANAAAETLCEDKDFIANLKKVGAAMSLDVAMFGRMITGDALSSVDAAVHVGHAISVHGQAVETDFFTAVDDLVPGDTGHLGEAELTSPLFYGYYVIDLGQLAGNLAGVDNAAEVAAVMVSKMLKLVSENVVGAKKGSTAPYSSSDLVLVEIGNGQPRTLAEAFRSPSKPTLQGAVESLSKYLLGKDRMYGNRGAQRMVAASVETGEGFGSTMTIDELAEAVGGQVRGGMAAQKKAA